MRFWITVSFVIVVIIAALAAFVAIKKDTVKVGLLYSKTGTMAISEQPIAETLKLKIEQINQQGGLLGKYIEIVEFDGASDEQTFAKGAKYLTSQGINTLFGCWTSASRKAVKPIIEANDALLFYPVQYEGVEQSDNIIYLGATPNQQLNPIVSYIKRHLGKRIFIVGSNYIYPRISGTYLSEMAKLVGLEIVAQHYLPLGATDFQHSVEQIKALKPDIILNTLNGESNLHFFKSLLAANLTAKHLPVFSTSMDEHLIKSITNTLGQNALNNHFLTGSYFHTIDNDQNQSFIKTFQSRFGSDYLVTNAAFNTAIAVELWQRAVKNSHSFDPMTLVKKIGGDSLNSPSGIIYVDSQTHHLHKTIRIAQINPTGLNIVWQSDVLVQPLPFPIFKSIDFWRSEEQTLFQDWHQRWQSNQSQTLGASYE